MGGVQFVAVGVGAALGAWARWGLSLWLNAQHPLLSFGTLAANLGGGFLMGIALGFFLGRPELDPAWRLFIATGFLGGLTTFSTFSAESLLLLQRGDWAWAFAHTVLHVVGALACCYGGWAAWRALT